jgi:hypothetical protein
MVSLLLAFSSSVHATVAIRILIRPTVIRGDFALVIGLKILQSGASRSR